MSHKKRLNELTNSFIRLLSSNLFFYATTVFFFAQASWFALSIRYPIVYDEQFHLNAIKLFSGQVSPFITSQTPAFEYDRFGSLAYGNVSLYHYLMSVPYRVLDAVISNPDVLVVVMRMMNIGFVVLGLVIFRKLLLMLSVRRSVANVSILLTSLVPLFTSISATISYDNMLFVISMAYLYFGAKLVSGGQKEKWGNFVAALLLGMLGSLVKFTFLPVFLITQLYLLINILRASGYDLVKSVHLLRSWLRSKGAVTLTLLVSATLCLSILFTLRYIVSVVKYHTPIPDCAKVLTVERCSSNGVYSTNLELSKTKNEREVPVQKDYVQMWFSSVSGGFGITTAASYRTVEYSLSPPLFMNLLFLGFWGGTASVLLAWRSVFSKEPTWAMLATAFLALVISVFAFNYMSYYEYRADVNIQSRYLLGFVPIFIATVGVAVNYLIKSRTQKSLLVLALFILFTQGGGVTTHILGSKSSWYWRNNTVIEVNTKLRAIINPVIKN